MPRSHLTKPARGEGTHSGWQFRHQPWLFYFVRWYLNLEDTTMLDSMDAKNAKVTSIQSETGVVA